MNPTTPSCLSPGLLLPVAICSLAPLALAQQAPLPAPPTAAELAKYDVNRNGRLDPSEQAALEADRARAAATPVSGEVVELTPFEVREDNRGYLATNTMSGTRLNTRLEDLASSISVVTKQQMTDFGLLDLNDVFNYEANTEGTGNYTAFEVDRNGMVSDQVQNNPQAANRIRGVGAANIALDNFATSGRVPIDPINIDALEISRGPNSNIFGLGEGSGTVNLVGSTARMNRSSTSTEFRFDDIGGWRTALDVNRALIPDKLGVRVSGVRQHDAFRQKPSGYDTKRFNAMVRVQPFKNTSIRASYQLYDAHGTRPTAVTPRDAISYWKSVGSPTWDPVTSTVTRNGVATVLTYDASNNLVGGNPVGLAGQNFVDPVIFVDGGIQLWQISRLPAATATNGPNNMGGTLRLLESQVEPVRTNRPLYSTVPGLSDRSIFDYAHVNLAAPNYLKDKDEMTTIVIEQYLLNQQRNKLAVQLAWQREDADRTNRNTIGSSSATGASYYLYVDPNSRLLDGRPNPFFLKPYVGVGEPVSSMEPYTRDSYRAQGLYILDMSESAGWKKWIGRHQLLGYYEERKTKSFRYRFRDVMISDNPIYAPAGQPKGNQSQTGAFAPSPTATRPYFHFYAGDNQGANVDYAPSGYSLGNYPFSWFNPATNAWVTDQAALGRSGITEGTAGGSTGVFLNLIQTNGAMMQNTLLDGRIVTTFGRREDYNRNKAQRPSALKPDGWEFDYDAMDGWVGDWALRSGITKTGGIVVKPFRSWSWSDRSHLGSFSELLTGLTVYYNKSDSFRPEPPAISILLNDLPNPSSIGKDYGFTINLGSKFVLRANRYSTRQVNSRAGQSAIFATRTLRVDFERFAGNNDAISLQRQARVWLTAQGLTGQALTDGIASVMKLSPDVVSTYNNNTISETSDVIAKGNEIELNYNPTSTWTLRANITRQQSIDANLSPNIPGYIAERLPIWESIIDPRTGTKWLDTGYNGDNPQTGSGTPRQFLQGNVISPLAIVQATEGKNRPETREWRVNVSTNYRLSGVTENQYLKRMNVGGAVRWESKGAIGYYGIPVNGDIGAATQLDPNRPIWNRGHTYLDAFVGYTTKIYHDKWRARFQINVRNLQESHARLQKVGAYPDGRGHTFRIVDPRVFIFSATFDL